MGRSDVLIVGGGIIGLAIALELHQQGTQVTVLSRDFAEAAGHAAAGMLAPSAEKIVSEPMAELCFSSLDLYPNWISKLEDLTGQDTGYWPCGILVPELRDRNTNSHSNSNLLPLSAQATHCYQSGLSSDVVGAHFYPEDAQVDNRALMKALRMAVQEAGIDIKSGVSVEGFIQKKQRVIGLRTSAGEMHAEHYVLATGAWSQEILPIPVTPRKGQMASVRVPLGYGQAQPLRRVLFGRNIYIVPRRDGRIILGATVEDVGFALHNTPAGIKALFDEAIALYPVLKDFAIDECWWGFRPATPDELPILGAGPCENLTLATGHYRNGVLLAPITAKLIADQILDRTLDQAHSLLDAFSYQRFQLGESSAVSDAEASGKEAGGQEAGSQKAGGQEARGHTAVMPLQSRQILQTQQTRDFSGVSMQTIDTSRPIAPKQDTSAPAQDTLTIAGKTFRSRLMTGTGKFSSLETMRQSFAASGSEIVTVAVRRVQTNAPGHEGLAEAIDWTKIWMLPNTAGCKDAEEAIRVARLGREMAKLLGQEDNNFVKLEVIPDAKYLLPDPIDTLKAAEQLVKEGFAVLPYINADPLLAKRLEEAGCATVMPLGSPIGSGQGIRNAANIEIIIENAKIPVVVDAGIGTPSEAAFSMEMGADALLVNSAIALATNPVAMGRAMGMATQAGRLAYQSGRIPVKSYAIASSPTTGTVNS